MSTQILDFPNISLFPGTLSSATRETTRVPGLLNWVSRFVLLVVNRICTKILQNITSKIASGWHMIINLDFVLASAVLAILTFIKKSQTLSCYLFLQKFLLKKTYETPCW